MLVSFKRSRRRPIAAGAIFLIVAAALLPIGTSRAQTAADYQQGSSPAPASAEAHHVFIATVHLDGNGNVNGDAKHPAEPFPARALPSGGGLILTPPSEDGTWRVRAFLFEPRQVIVFEGDPLTLTFVGVQGPSHRIQIDGMSEIIDLKRGEAKTVTIATNVPGSIGFRSLDRLPSMQGSIVVLPRR